MVLREQGHRFVWWPPAKVFRNRTIAVFALPTTPLSFSFQNFATL
uniref:Uncharacterized protein n=1 Tax=Siphoviridae sp. ctdYc1 TaxID=2826399 RepID=A0A8S5N055_9CAUD|nr:MAG TPA: hypothetical protein [Siphoviridae sp. ctdYc1]